MLCVQFACAPKSAYCALGLIDHTICQLLHIAYPFDIWNTRNKNTPARLWQCGTRRCSCRREQSWFRHWRSGDPITRVGPIDAVAKRMQARKYKRTTRKNTNNRKTTKTLWNTSADDILFYRTRATKRRKHSLEQCDTSCQSHTEFDNTEINENKNLTFSTGATNETPGGRSVWRRERREGGKRRCRSMPGRQKIGNELAKIIVWNPGCTGGWRYCCATKYLVFENMRH